MNPKIFRTVYFGLAILVALLVSVLPAAQLSKVAFIPQFFEAQLPILIAGALTKYLFKD